MRWVAGLLIGRPVRWFVHGVALLVVGVFTGGVASFGRGQLVPLFDREAGRPDLVPFREGRGGTDLVPPDNPDTPFDLVRDLVPPIGRDEGTRSRGASRDERDEVGTSKGRGGCLAVIPHPDPMPFSVDPGRSIPLLGSVSGLA
jgi:hypothetical protein